MSRFNWHTVASAELALLLKEATLDASRAVGTSTVYQLTVDGRDVLAVSLPDGQAIVVELAAPARALRRHIDSPNPV
ncbi:MAG: hypothetical protein ABIZ09_07180 [Rhodoferax sp.]|jgi:hypothetical protein